MRKYLDLFVSEAGEHIQAATAEAAKISSGITGPETLNALFRHFHSIKGMAASMGFEPITSLSHSVEDLFDALRKGRMEAPPGLGDLVVEALDACSAMVARSAAAPDAGIDLDPSPIIAKVRGWLPAPTSMRGTRPATGAASPPAAALPAPAPPARPLPAHTFRCLIGIDPRADFPGARAALALRRLEKVGTVAGCDPQADVLLTSEFNGDITVVVQTERPEAAVRACLEDLLDLRRLEIVEQIPEAPPAPSSGAAAPDAEPGGPQGTVRIPTAALDRFLESMSEMMARRGALAESLRSRQIESARQALEKLSESIDSLRGQVMELRLMPFEHIVPRLARTIRDVARRTGRRVTHQITGGDVSLDRSVLEEIIDPLNHILRNAVDHGIELPPERELAGKPPGGAIRIDVSREGDHVQVVVEDDGRGMDLEAIRRTALAGGFATEAELAAMDESRILMLTTIPGFSTARQVTEVSGRGVGMDVVRTRIEAMRGHMSVSSSRGRGTRICLSVPLTVAVIDAFLVEGRSGLFAVPAGPIASVDLVERSRVRSTLSGSFIADVPSPGSTEGGALVPLVDLDEAFGPPGERGALRGPVQILAYQVNGTRGALAVSKVRGRGDLVVKPLGPPLERLRKYSGVALLDDGGLALILDLANLARSA